MPRKSAKNKRPAQTGPTTTGPVGNAGAAVAEAPASPLPPAAAEPPFEPTGTYTPAKGEPQGDRGRFRSWTTDPQRRYSKLVDHERHLIVLLFDEKPPADVLTAMKGAQMEYKQDYEGFSHAWMCQNDFQGRGQVKAIETLIRELRPGPASSGVTL